MNNIMLGKPTVIKYDLESFLEKEKDSKKKEVPKMSDYFFEFESINEGTTSRFNACYEEKKTEKSKKEYLLMNNVISFKTVPKRICLIQNGHYTFIKDMDTCELKSYDGDDSIENHLRNETMQFPILANGKLMVCRYRFKRKNFKEKIEEFTKQRKMF